MEYHIKRRIMCAFSALAAAAVFALQPAPAAAKPASNAYRTALERVVDFEATFPSEGLTPPDSRSLYYTDALYIYTADGTAHPRLEYRLIVQGGALVYAVEGESTIFGYDENDDYPAFRIRADSTHALMQAYNSGVDFALCAISGGIYLKTPNSLLHMREDEGEYDADAYAALAATPLSKLHTYNSATLAMYPLKGAYQPDETEEQGTGQASIDETLLEKTGSEGKWRFKYKGETMKSRWVKKDGAKYYCTADGTLATGWAQPEGTQWYYFHTKTATMQTGWQKIAGRWYYLNPQEGSMATGLFRDNTGKLYYTNASGAMQSSKWQKSGGEWYYLTATGAAAENRWQKLGSWYYFGNEGKMLTGWQTISGTWYYFKTSGAMQTGWLKQGSKWYYLKPSGAMATNESLRINGKQYKFNSSGAML